MFLTAIFLLVAFVGENVVSACTLSCDGPPETSNTTGTTLWHPVGTSTPYRTDTKNCYLILEWVKIECEDGRSLEAKCQSFSYTWTKSEIMTFSCCDGVTCNNGGSCYKGVCHCGSGWTGEQCDTPVCSGGCNGGSCNQPDTCDCPNILDGPNCDNLVIPPSIVEANPQIIEQDGQMISLQAESEFIPFSFTISGTLTVSAVNYQHTNGTIEVIQPWHDDLAVKSSSIYQQTAAAFCDFLEELGKFTLLSVVPTISEFQQGNEEILVLYSMKVKTMDQSFDSVDKIAEEFQFNLETMMANGFLEQFDDKFIVSSINSTNIVENLQSHGRLSDGSSFNMTETLGGGSFRVNDTIAINNETTVSSDDWPDDLNNPNSAMFKALVKIFQPIVSISFSQIL